MAAFLTLKLRGKARRLLIVFGDRRRRSTRSIPKLTES